MDAPRRCEPPAPRWPDWRWLALLLLLTTGLRVWQVRHTEVLSRDSVSHIRAAWRLEHGDWRAALRTSPTHPGYPLSILAVSLPLRHVADGDSARVMQLSA